MKRKRRFWNGFGRGFAVTAILLCAAAGGLYGMIVADEHTRSAGFGDGTPAVSAAITEEGLTLRVFDFEITF